jgi:hypothetical protein
MSTTPRKLPRTFPIHVQAQTANFLPLRRNSRRDHNVLHELAHKLAHNKAHNQLHNRLHNLGSAFPR